MNGHTQMVEMLLKYDGADINNINAKNVRGSSYNTGLK